MAKLIGKSRAWYCAALAALLITAVFCGCTGEGMDKKASNQTLLTEGGAPIAEIQWEEKIYWNGTIEENFDGNTVLVVMDKNIGGVNKAHDKSFFGDIEIESIRDLTEVTNPKTELIDWEKFHQILELKLPGDGKENVIKAIRHLEKIDGIMYAGPNHWGELGSVMPGPGIEE